LLGTRDPLARHKSSGGLGGTPDELREELAPIAPFEFIESYDDALIVHKLLVINDFSKLPSACRRQS
jgi:hypothetical protein